MDDEFNNNDVHKAQVSAAMSWCWETACTWSKAMLLPRLVDLQVPLRALEQEMGRSVSCNASTLRELIQTSFPATLETGPYFKVSV